MGKHFDQVDQKKEQLLKSQKVYEQAQLRKECSHQKVKEGRPNLTLELIDKTGIYRCKRCGNEFSMDPISVNELLATLY